ncbi:hypothetical protein I6F65_03095 [Pseudoalteromonas sp. SWXJZ94C]|jgi:hypothetical protein|uniref:hypothetical protein n=1 Tax=unclassified Pseudoalteromonas TaxID=194690 RepID=UPI000429269C|nr:MULTISPECIES: hypothetical protein [unclassified Pseudoalteromonas]MBH0055936.1 hypothetical protein [Pseudoalteromonas sp. SWXJZ94C]
MFINKLKNSALLIVGLCVLAACSSETRFHEVQSARLDECNYKADKEYYECLDNQDSNYEEFKKQQQADTK